MVESKALSLSGTTDFPSSYWGQNLETLNAMFSHLGNRKAGKSLSRWGTGSHLILRTTLRWQVEGRQERRGMGVQDAEWVGGTNSMKGNQTQPFPQGARSSLVKLRTCMSASTYRSYTYLQVDAREIQVSFCHLQNEFMVICNIYLSRSYDDWITLGKSSV